MCSYEIIDKTLSLSLETPYLFSSTLICRLGFNGWEIGMCSHFSTPQMNMGLIFEPSPNNKSNIGMKLGCVVDDQIPMSNIETHLVRNS
jgi:hypothetical protein